MASQLLVIHERVGNWARHLRPRLSCASTPNRWPPGLPNGRDSLTGETPLRVVETRSAADLEGALAGAVCPLLVVDLGRRPRAGLDDLGRGLRVAPDALSLVLDPESHEGTALLARELGATSVILGPVPPPTVARLLARWVPLAQRRAEAAGWSASAPESAGPEPWSWLTPLLAGVPGPPRTTRH